MRKVEKKLTHRLWRAFFPSFDFWSQILV